MSIQNLLLKHWLVSWLKCSQHYSQQRRKFPLLSCIIYTVEWVQRNCRVYRIQGKEKKRKKTSKQTYKQAKTDQEFLEVK